LKGQRFSIAHVGAVAPLFYGLHSAGRERSVSFHQAETSDFSRLIDYRFEDDGSFGSLRPRLGGIFWRDARNQTFLRSLRRENDGSVFAG
jgi:hypothetical protein